MGGELGPEREEDQQTRESAEWESGASAELGVLLSRGSVEQGVPMS